MTVDIVRIEYIYNKFAFVLIFIKGVSAGWVPPAPQHPFSTYQYFWVLGASTYPLDHNPTRIHMNLNMDKNNVRQLDQNDERRQDNDQPSHEDESDEEYLTPSASDKS
jgi:hypothetical protein